MVDKQALLVEAWTDSCTNLRSAQDRFRTTVNVFLVSSFAITAFLLGDKSPFKDQALKLGAEIDVFLLIIFSLIIALTYREIRNARIAVELYQVSLKKSLDNPHLISKDDFFPPTAGKKPSMSLHNELFTACVAIAV